MQQSDRKSFFLVFVVPPLLKKRRLSFTGTPFALRIREPTSGAIEPLGGRWAGVRKVVPWEKGGAMGGRWARACHAGAFASSNRPANQEGGG